MEEKLTLMLVGDDIEACSRMTETLASGGGLAVVGVTNNPERAIKYASDASPDIVIADAGSGAEGCGAEFLKRLRAEGLSLPCLLVLAAKDDEDTRRLAREACADFIADAGASFSAQCIDNFLKIAQTMLPARRAATLREGRAPTAEQEEKQTQRRITAELDKLGISSKCVGYRYLVDAIGIIMKQPVQHVCRLIGSRRGKTENSVERAMQNAINRAWASTDPAELSANYTARIKSAKGIPTITEFVYHYANKLNNE